MAKKPKHYWNYRVLEQTCEKTGETWCGFHEVHYENDKPVLYTTSPCSPIWHPGDPFWDKGETVLDMMALALSKPVLRVQDFPNGETVLFRPQRVTLTKELAEAVAFTSEKDLIEHIRGLFPWSKLHFLDEDVEFRYLTYDHRTSWETYIVLVKDYPAGYTNNIFGREK